MEEAINEEASVFFVSFNKHGGGEGLSSKQGGMSKNCQLFCQFKRRKATLWKQPGGVILGSFEGKLKISSLVPRQNIYHSLFMFHFFGVIELLANHTS